MINIRKSTALPVALLLICFFSGCTKRERTLAGIVIGAGIGALIGSVVGNTGGAVAGVLIGGTAGGVVGNASGAVRDGQDRDHTDSGYWER